MDYQTIGIKMNDAVAECMQERGISEDDVRQVLAHAEEEGTKLYIEGENHFLGKKRINNFTVNVEYIVGGDEIELVNAYSHVVKLTAD
jgi:hypothetical protein